jgi:hypothetical protein
MVGSQDEQRTPEQSFTLLGILTGGVIAWDMNEKAAAKTFELILPPGERSVWLGEKGVVCSS